ncbi:MAG: exodeoxyribonuclease V subunit gamma [Ostreibacterium sp.]
MMTEISINTYYSSHTEALLGTLFSSLQNERDRRCSPFAKTSIIVPNSGMQRYLELSIAKELGICAQIEISFASHFLHNLYQHVLSGEVNIAHIDERKLAFLIVMLWQSIDAETTSIFSDTGLVELLSQYHTTDQRYRLAMQVAQLFRRYLHERPELIMTWQDNHCLYAGKHPHEAWQMRLFNQLSLGSYKNNIIQSRFHTKLKQHQETLPTLHLFGFHLMPPVQLLDFSVLSTVSSVQAYLFNPSVTYWQDVIPDAIKAELDLTKEAETELMTLGNPLLASWGQAGKYLIEQLNESNIEPINIDSEMQVPVNSVLGWLQSMIRASDDYTAAEFASFKQAEGLSPLAQQEISTGQLSLSLHVSANPRREVEVLYDHLCALFDRQSLKVKVQINASDILVMVADLRDYAPHIQAVFGSAQPPIPFSLANQRAAEADVDTQAFLALLSVIENNFSAQSLFDAISETSVRKSFGFTLTDLENIRYWFMKSHYSHYFHDDSQGHSGSLEKLLDSLLLAFVGGEDCQINMANDTVIVRHSLPAYQSTQVDSLKAFCQLMTAWSAFINLKSYQKTIGEWRDIFYQLAEQFLGEGNNMVVRLRQWHDHVLKDTEGYANAVVDKMTTDLKEYRFDYDTIITDLKVVLENEALHGPFLSGGISFCAMVPMRSIPAKMICLLGLDQAFPAVIAKDPLDLREMRPRWSDRNINKEYKYFFLETLMSVRERLYLSYVGLNDKTGETIPPSVLVDELFGFIRKYNKDYADAVKTVHPLQGFLGDVEQVSYQQLYAHNPTQTVSIKLINDSQLIEFPQQFSSQDISAYLTEPFTFYISQQLLANMIEMPDNVLAEHEMIALETGLETWTYKKFLLDQTLFGKDAVQQLIRDNQYPPSTISEALLQTEREKISPMIEALRPFSDIPCCNLSHFIRHQQTVEPSIEGTNKTFYFLLAVDKYGANGLWDYALSGLKPKKLLSMWVEHVLLNTLPDLPSYQTTLWVLDKKDQEYQVSQKVFKPLASRAQAHVILSHILCWLRAIFSKPYAITLALAGQKAVETLLYKDTDYPLYPQLIRQASDASDETLHRLFSVIDKQLTKSLED